MSVHLGEKGKRRACFSYLHVCGATGWSLPLQAAMCNLKDPFPKGSETTLLL